MSQSSRKYAKKARALYKTVPQLVSSYPVPLAGDSDTKEINRLRRVRPTQSFSYVDKLFEDLKGKTKLPFINRLLATNFLTFNFKEEVLSDSIISDLQGLLTRQYQRGLEAGRKLKRRVK